MVFTAMEEGGMQNHPAGMVAMFDLVVAILHLEAVSHYSTFMMLLM